MTKVMDRAKRGNDPTADKMIGDVLVKRGRRYEEAEEYPKARSEYKLALAYYAHALKESEGADGYPLVFREGLDKAASNARNYLSEVDKKEHDLEKQTHHLPRWLKGLMARIKGVHVILIFILAILFSSPAITGAVIGNGNNFTSYLGIFFFLLGWIFSYFYVWRKFLSLRVQDQY